LSLKPFTIGALSSLPPSGAAAGSTQRFGPMLAYRRYVTESVNIAD
jgi:hypothetical protein